MDGCFDKDGNKKPNSRCQEVELSKFDPVFETQEENEAYLKELQKPFERDLQDDCVVEAFCELLDVSYPMMHFNCEMYFGRRKDKGLSVFKLFAGLKYNNYRLFIKDRWVYFKIIDISKDFNKFKIFGKKRIKRVPVYKLAKKYSKGRYLITDPSHAAALIDGKLVDPSGKFNNFTEIKRMIKLTF